MVFARSRVSFLTLAVSVAFFMLRIVVVIGIFLQRNLTGWRQGDITSARKLLTNRSYGVSYHLCSG